MPSEFVCQQVRMLPLLADSPHMSCDHLISDM